PKFMSDIENLHTDLTEGFHLNSTVPLITLNTLKLMVIMIGWISSDGKL
ncbi:5318_t:CDS:1, partial [Funneliformis geosporum]